MNTSGGDAQRVMDGFQEAMAEVDASPRDDDWAVRAVEAILVSAHRSGATDIHIREQRDGLAISVRRLGTMGGSCLLRPSRCDELFGRLRVLARLPAFHRNEPSDGRIDWSSPDGTPLPLRLSLLPSLNGQSAVIRFPRQGDRVPSLEDLGMEPPVVAAVEAALQAGEGMLLVTGPAGSGKTTTLYALMERLHSMRGGELSFLTVEDPVEREMPFAVQMSVAPLQGLTFERGLRAGLRHDPNVLLVGEIRDAETAAAAVQAAVSGHLLLSSIHAGRADRVFTRLLAMGVEPFLVASAVTGAMAQRLVKTADGDGATGRTGVFEFISVTEELRELILGRASLRAIAEECRRLRIGDLDTLETLNKKESRS